MSLPYGGQPIPTINGVFDVGICAANVYQFLSVDVGPFLGSSVPDLTHNHRGYLSFKSHLTTINEAALLSKVHKIGRWLSAQHTNIAFPSQAACIEGANRQPGKNSTIA